MAGVSAELFADVHIVDERGNPPRTRGIFAPQFKISITLADDLSSAFWLQGELMTAVVKGKVAGDGDLVDDHRQAHVILREQLGGAFAEAFRCVLAVKTGAILGHVRKAILEDGKQLVD